MGGWKVIFSVMGGDGKFMGQGPFDLMHYVKAAFGGAVCCSVTHGGTTPIDVVKTRMQLEPAKYTSFVSTGRSIISAEGSGALFTGVMPTFQGYFVQGWFKFCGVEICKTRFAMGMSEQDAWKNRDFITLGGSAVAEFVAGLSRIPATQMGCWPLDRSWLPRTVWSTVCTLVSVRCCSSKFRTPWQNSAFNRRWRRPSTRILALLRLK